MEATQSTQSKIAQAARELTEIQDELEDVHGEPVAELPSMTVDNNAEVTIWRHNGICEQCEEVVGEDELVACHGENGLKDYACPQCFTAHYIID